MTETARIDPGFKPLLGDCDLAAVSESADTIYAVWPDLTLGFVNRGWTQFALQNNGVPTVPEHWSLGRCILEAIAQPLRPFFESNYAKCLREQRPWEHCYECSSPHTYRRFHMLTFPLGNAEGLLVVNSLRQEAAHTRTPRPAVASLYRNEHGVVTQCSHCRRVRRVGLEHTWDWVPDWVSRCPADTSHGLCEPCMSFHYSPNRSLGAGFVPSFRTR